jgi:transcriptional regulator with XRE-family HTH domain
MSDELGDSWPGRQLFITQRLRQRRAELGLTQKQVVRRLAGAGVRTTNRALSSLEHGAGIDVAKLPELAAALECTVTYLVGMTAEPHRWEPDPTPARTRRAAPRPGSSAGAAAPRERPDPGARPAPESLIIGTAIPERVSRTWSGERDA